MFTCAPASQRWWLYSPATGQWRAVSPSPGVMCSGDCDWGLDAAGRTWLAFSQTTCPDPNYHSPCSAVYVFQNVQTGEVRQDPSNGSAMVDLNAPNPTRTVCTPLHGSPLLIFRGNFALSAVYDNNLNEKVYLERCGTRLHRLLWSRPASQSGAEPSLDAHEVVWIAHPGPFLTGLTLPGLQRFTIRVPERPLRDPSCASLAGCIGGVALTNERLYIVTGPHSQVWAASLPLPAKRRHK
jgi:hypothetical protein